MNLHQQFHWMQERFELIFFMHIFQARIVGGAVRNTLLHLPLSGEIDLATPFTPTEMIYISDIMHLKHIPTGISHGTITILNRQYTASYFTYITEILEHIHNDKTKKASAIQQAIMHGCQYLLENRKLLEQNNQLIQHEEQVQIYEFTTLRNDIETDGRHAKIAFTKNWQIDADRRDFTINALYVDVNLQVHDLVNGIADIKQHFVRFVGMPSLRIQEDYLRILRFFRFNAHYGMNKYSQDALNACNAYVHGLKQISQERLFAELYKTFQGKYVLSAIEKMMDCKIFETLNWPKPNMKKLEQYAKNMAKYEHKSQHIAFDINSHHQTSLKTKDLHSQDMIISNSSHSALPATQASSLNNAFIQTSLTAEMIFAMCDGNWNILKMPKKTLQIIKTLQATVPVSLVQWHKAFYQNDIDWIHAKILMEDVQDISFLQHFKHTFIFPISGRDIIEFCTPGPKISSLQNQVLEWWLENLCKPTKTECIAYLHTLLHI